jgi:hypothetical protein
VEPAIAANECPRDVFSVFFITYAAEPNRTPSPAPPMSDGVDPVLQKPYVPTAVVATAEVMAIWVDIRTAKIVITDPVNTRVLTELIPTYPRTCWIRRYPVLQTSLSIGSTNVF